MSEKARFLFNKNKFPLFILMWIFLYFAPWATWMGRFPWIQMGVSIIIFALPGVAASLYLAGKRFTLLSHFISGMAISIFFVGVLGLLGRILHLPFDFIKPMFFLAGVVVFLLIKKYSHSDYQWYRPIRFSVVTFVLLAFVLVFAITLSFLDQSVVGDDLSYLAYLTNWQHAQALDFREVIFNTGSADSIRFWLAMFPMNLAFLSEISNLHGILLIGLYLEPFFVTIAILSAYSLYEDLLRSEYLAISALLLQFMFLVLRNGVIYSGVIFFNHLAHDKAFAGFILVPIFFLAIFYFVESFNARSGILVFCVGLSLALTHPVTLAFAIFIAGIYAGIVMVAKKEYKKLAFTFAILGLIITPVASMRVIESPAVRHYLPFLNSIKLKGVFDLESALNVNKGIDSKILYINGTPFYGFNLDIVRIGSAIVEGGNVIQAFFSWSYLWLLGFGFLWSLFNLKKNAIAPFIAATSFLVLLATIPYTGWLVGYFVSARLLLRASWMMQFGLIGTLLLFECIKYVLYKVRRHDQVQISVDRVVWGIITTISLVAISYFYVPYVSRGGWRPLTTLNQYRNNLQSLGRLGEYIENNISAASVFVAPAGLRDYLPGISSKSKVVFFREKQFSLYPVEMGKIDLISSPDASVNITDIVNTLTEYHINYILTKNSSLKDYYLGFPTLFRAEDVGGFWIIEFQKSDL